MMEIIAPRLEVMMEDMATVVDMVVEGVLMADEAGEEVDSEDGGKGDSEEDGRKIIRRLWKSQAAL